MASNDSLALLNLAHTLDSPPDVCLNVDGKKIYAPLEVLSKQGFFGMHFDASESDVVFVSNETGGMHFLDITKHSYDVVRASIFWMMTGVIDFDVGECLKPSATSACLPKPVPAFDVYAFAHWYGIGSLAEVALTTMKANFKAASILGQLFEDRVKDHAPVKRAMTEYTKDFWGEVQEQAEYTSVLGGMVDRQCSLHGQSFYGKVPSASTEALVHLLETSIMLALLLPKSVDSPSSATSVTAELLTSIHEGPETREKALYVVGPNDFMWQEELEVVEEAKVTEESKTVEELKLAEDAKAVDEAKVAEEAKSVAVAAVIRTVVAEKAALKAYAKAQLVEKGIHADMKRCREICAAEEAYAASAKQQIQTVKKAAEAYKAATAGKEEAYRVAGTVNAMDAAVAAVAAAASIVVNSDKKGKKKGKNDKRKKCNHVSLSKQVQ